MRCLQDFAVNERHGASQVTAIGALRSVWAGSSSTRAQNCRAVGRIHFGELDRTPSSWAEAFTEALSHAGVEVELGQDTHVAIWNKFVFLTGMSATRALLTQIMTEGKSEIAGSEAHTLTANQTRKVPTRPQSSDRTDHLMRSAATNQATPPRMIAIVKTPVVRLSSDRERTTVAATPMTRAGKT